MVDRLVEIQAHVGKNLDVSRETLDRLVCYEGLVRTWTGRINLVSRSDWNRIWHRHILNSAQAASVLQLEGHWIDVGSGAGFPGLVLAILGHQRPDFTMTLVEPNRKKALFLKTVARELGLDVNIVNDRVEPYAKQCETPYAVVTSRAVAALDTLLNMCFGLFQAETKGLFLKGETVEAEWGAAKLNWDIRGSILSMGSQKVGNMVLIEHIAMRESHNYAKA